MPFWFWVTFIVVAVVSLFSVLFFYKQSLHVMKRHVHILGGENADLVRTPLLRAFLFLFALSIVLTLIAYFLFFWSSL